MTHIGHNSESKGKSETRCRSTDLRTEDRNKPSQANDCTRQEVEARGEPPINWKWESAVEEVDSPNLEQTSPHPIVWVRILDTS